MEEDGGRASEGRLRKDISRRREGGSGYKERGAGNPL